MEPLFAQELGPVVAVVYAATSQLALCTGQYLEQSGRRRPTLRSTPLNDRGVRPARRDSHAISWHDMKDR